MQKEIKRSVQLICTLLLGSRDPAVVTYTPSKTELTARAHRYFKRTPPHRKGISDARIQNFLYELEADPLCNIHSVTVLKDDDIICEAYAPGFERGLAHLSHSMSKTVTGIAAAILADEEKLDADMRLADVYTEFKLPKSVGDIKIKELLLMSSGLSFSELGAVTSTAWTEDFLSSEQVFESGEGFSYNSMNSYILARVIEHLSGESFGDFVRTRLFEPLRITNYFWEKGPEGTEKGGWGLYLAPEDWLKIATLFLTGGKFEGKVIISHISMLELLLDRNPHSETRDENFDYAGHLNVGKDSPAVLLNGLFGQNVYINTKNKIAVMVNAGNSDLFKKSKTLDIIMKYFSADIADERVGLFASFRSYRALIKQEHHFFETRSPVPLHKHKSLLEQLRIFTDEFPEEWEDILGAYLLPMNNDELLPLITRFTQNNFEGGIDTVEFVRGGHTPRIRFSLGDTVRDIPIGIYSHAETVEDFHGEKYIIRALGGVRKEGNETVWTVEFVFPELPNTRILTIRKSAPDEIRLTFTETPGADAVTPLFDSLVNSSSMASLAVGMIERKLGEGFIKKKISELFSPSFRAPLAGSEVADEVLNEENKRIEREREEILSVPFISNFIRAEIRESENESETVTPRRRRFFNFIKTIFRKGQKAVTEEEDE